MVMEREAMGKRFADLTSEMGSALDGLPLDLLAVSVEIQEQAQLVHAQLKRAKNMEDAQEEQLQADIKALLEEDKEGTADPGLLDPIMGKLGITSIPAAEKEIRALEAERKNAEEDRREKDAGVMAQAISLLKKLKISLGGTDSDGEDEAVQEPATSGRGNASGPQPPDDFKCPISLELMRDPVIVSTGQTYDRQFIEQWLKEGHKTCPKTQQVLSHPVLIPNYSLRSLIQQWCESEGVELPKKPIRGGVARMPAPSSGNEAAGDRHLVRELKEKLLIGDMEMQRSAAEEFRKLAKRSMGNRVCIADAGVIPLLVGLLGSPDKKTQEHAVTALLNLSINDPNKGAIVSAGAIQPIVDVLKNGSMEARENAAATLFSLSVIDENKISIGQSGAIPALVELLQTGTVRGKKDAATALFNLSIYQGNKARAVRAGVVSPLMELLVNRGAGMTDEALAILAILATCLEGRTSIGQASAVPVLVDLIETGSPRNKENAASVLLSLCLNGVNHTEDAIKLNAEVQLSQLLRNGTQRAKRKASQLLQHMRDQRDLS